MSLWLRYAHLRLAPIKARTTPGPGSDAGIFVEYGGEMKSLCETCNFCREVVTAKGSRFLLCRLSQSNPSFPKYPPQPVVRCSGHERKLEVGQGPKA
jgi:hypothetical protein